MSETGEAQAKLDQAVSRLGDALERIVDGLDRQPVPASGPSESEMAAVSEVAELRETVSRLQSENEALRTAGRAAAEGIGETIAALREARN